MEQHTARYKKAVFPDDFPPEGIDVSSTNGICIGGHFHSEQEHNQVTSLTSKIMKTIPKGQRMEGPGAINAAHPNDPNVVYSNDA
jgi:hypothetical protein